jgi:hypothetical protein
MTVVLMKPPAGLLVLADTFLRLATGVVQLQQAEHAITPELREAYAAVTCAYAAALRDRVSAIPERSPAWPEVIDHLVMRLHQSREEDILLHPLDVLDQLAGRLLALEPLVLNT